MKRLIRVAVPGLIALALAAGTAWGADKTPKKTVLYAAVGSELIQYDVDATAATLTRLGSTTLPDTIQYAWPHPSHKYIYVAWSSGAGSTHHGVSAFRIDTKTGAPELIAPPTPLAARPIHITVDIDGTHVLVTHNSPSSVTIRELEVDGSIGAQVTQPSPLETGIYAHQMRVDPSNHLVILMARGNVAAGGKPEDPGSVRVFGYDKGVLTPRQTVAPGNGVGFHPRHLDFPPTSPWVFISMEPQNKLEVYRRTPEGRIIEAPLFIKDSLLDTKKVLATQAASAVHVHPNGRFVYQGNRATGTIGADPIYDEGGNNSIAVYAINQKTGEPTLIQNAPTHGLAPRTFALDAGGHILVAANQAPYLVREDGQQRKVSANLAVFRVGGDGKLKFMRTYDVETTVTKTLIWMGLISLP